MRKAVIDVGSNSVLLLVESHEGDQWRTVKESTWITSLGAGTRQTGILGQVGIDATLIALKSAFAIASEYEAESCIAGGTMAVRMASNSAEFLDRAASQGTPVKIISGDEEAELGFAAVAKDPTFAEYPAISIVDVGGQSTEIVVASRNDPGWDIACRISFPIGTLALLGQTLKEETPASPAIMAATAQIDDVLATSSLPGIATQPIVLGATGTNLVSIRERFEEWQSNRVHGALLEYEEVSRASSWLFSLPFKTRSMLIGMESGREATLPIGALILERAMFALKQDQCRVSVRGWRHALLEIG